MSRGLGGRLARYRAVIVLPVAVALVAVAVGPSRAVMHAGGPFYFAPPSTDECKSLANCSASVGPWVAVPAHGEATFLIGCPEPYGYLVGGTDARASSGNIHVWFDGNLGSPIGRVSAQGAVLLFHAASGNGQAGSFRPILGCLTLKPKNKVSTIAFVSARSVPGTAQARSLSALGRFPQRRSESMDSSTRPATWLDAQRARSSSEAGQQLRSRPTLLPVAPYSTRFRFRPFVFVTVFELSSRSRSARCCCPRSRFSTARCARHEQLARPG